MPDDDLEQSGKALKRHRRIGRFLNMLTLGVMGFGIPALIEAGLKGLGFVAGGSLYIAMVGYTIPIIFFAGVVLRAKDDSRKLEHIERELEIELGLLNQHYKALIYEEGQTKSSYLDASEKLSGDSTSYTQHKTHVRIKRAANASLFFLDGMLQTTVLCFAAIYLFSIPLTMITLAAVGLIGIAGGLAAAYAAIKYRLKLNDHIRELQQKRSELFDRELSYVASKLSDEQELDLETQHGDELKANSYHENRMRNGIHAFCLGTTAYALPLIAEAILVKLGIISFTLLPVIVGFAIATAALFITAGYVYKRSHKSAHEYQALLNKTTLLKSKIAHAKQNLSPEQLKKLQIATTITPHRNSGFKSKLKKFGRFAWSMLSGTAYGLLAIIPPLVLLSVALTPLNVIFAGLAALGLGMLYTVDKEIFARDKQQEIDTLIAEETALKAELIEVQSLRWADKRPEERDKAEKERKFIHSFREIELAVPTPTPENDAKPDKPEKPGLS